MAKVCDFSREAPTLVHQRCNLSLERCEHRLRVLSHDRQLLFFALQGGAKFSRGCVLLSIGGLQASDLLIEDLYFISD
jgi:hypothetical protein